MGELVGGWRVEDVLRVDDCDDDRMGWGWGW